MAMRMTVKAKQIDSNQTQPGILRKLKGLAVHDDSKKQIGTVTRAWIENGWLMHDVLVTDPDMIEKLTVGMTVSLGTVVSSS
jgi:hypothetical protein